MTRTKASTSGDDKDNSQHRCGGEATMTKTIASSGGDDKDNS